MFEIDPPFVRTRQALIVLDLQNDFLSPGCILPVEQPPDFLEKTFKLLPEFRTAGNVIWIRSLFKESRAINEPIGECESVITDKELAPKNRRGAHLQTLTRPSQRSIEQHRRLAEANGIELGGDGTIAVDEEDEEHL